MPADYYPEGSLVEGCSVPVEYGCEVAVTGCSDVALFPLLWQQVAYGGHLGLEMGGQVLEVEVVEKVMVVEEECPLQEEEQRVDVQFFLCSAQCLKAV